jgi:hypothetical protein
LSGFRLTVSTTGKSNSRVATVDRSSIDHTSSRVRNASPEVGAR